MDQFLTSKMRFLGVMICKYNTENKINSLPVMQLIFPPSIFSEPPYCKFCPTVLCLWGQFVKIHLTQCLFEIQIYKVPGKL